MITKTGQKYLQYKEQLWKEAGLSDASIQLVKTALLGRLGAAVTGAFRKGLNNVAQKRLGVYTEGFKKANPNLKKPENLQQLNSAVRQYSNYIKKNTSGIGGAVDRWLYNTTLRKPFLQQQRSGLYKNMSNNVWNSSLSGATLGKPPKSSPVTTGSNLPAVRQSTALATTGSNLSSTNVVHTKEPDVIDVSVTPVKKSLWNTPISEWSTGQKTALGLGGAYLGYKALSNNSNNNNNNSNTSGGYPRVVTTTRYY